ncbi:MAG TPA: glycosyltransferase family 8 protein [Noviherbaspirillum sp.]|nr:glycosyltransferase family 8 protein [Noviherbaspirillum sp.]
MIHIVCCTDENYAFNFPVIAQSVLEHHAPDEVRFHLLHSALSAPTAEKIDRYAADKGFAFSRQSLDDSVFATLPEIAYFTIAIYYRLLIPELLSQEHGKVLYLDMDVVVEGRLDELWNVDLAGKGAAVVEDGAPKHLDALDEQSPERYFNSGVMLINLDYWRQHKVKEQAIDFMVQHRDILRFPDQDALNVVLQNDLVFVSQKWNYHLNLDRKFLKRALKGRVAKDLAPMIVHFNQKVKPWMYHCRHPYTPRYWQLLKKTPFKDYRMKNKTVANVLFYWTPKPLRPVLWRRRFASLPQN